MHIFLFPLVLLLALLFDNTEVKKEQIPDDLVAVSGVGSYLSPATAIIQLARIANARHPGRDKFKRID
jgi:K+-transporting ATPase c subunit